MQLLFELNPHFTCPTLYFLSSEWAGCFELDKDYVFIIMVAGPTVLLQGIVFPSYRSVNEIVVDRPLG